MIYMAYDVQNSRSVNLRQKLSPNFGVPPVFQKAVRGCGCSLHIARALATRQLHRTMSSGTDQWRLELHSASDL